MKRIHTLVIAAFLMTFQLSFAAKVCLQDDVGTFWELTGGKVDKKTYTVRRIIPGCCAASGYADVTLDSFGVFKIAIYSSHLPKAFWPPVMISVNGDEFYNSTGTVDILADGIIDSNITLTNVSCNVLPPTITPPHKKQ